MYRPLPTTLILLLGQLVAQTLGSASLVPPTVTLTNQTSTGTLPTTSGASTTTTRTTSGASSNSQTTTSATSTSTAQYPSLSNVPTCVSDCLASGISRVGCSSVVDVNCFCVKPNFTAELVACILANCPDQVSSSETLAQQFCNVASLSPSLSFPPVPTTTSSPATTSDSTTTAPPTTSATSTNSSAASSRRGHIGQDTTLGLMISAFGCY
ncbi:hypothetical protein BJ912DRAFT_316317 [Pholiota molesta]|nr:hypothetical protein BJ912DRAFT_316317 [Pholiota molesta]